MAEDPEQAAIFDEAMADWTSHVAAAAVKAYDFSAFTTVVDVGGGNGTLLAGILAATPGLRGVVFDLPHVAERAKPTWPSLGLGNRCRAVGGDFFEDVPRRRRRIPPEARDPRLARRPRDRDPRACRRAMSAGREASARSRESIRRGSTPHRRAAARPPTTSTCSSATGGRQRSEPEFRALYNAAGFALTRLVPLPPTNTLAIEGVPA